MLGDCGTENKNNIFFVVSGIFSRRIDSVMLLGFECTINPQNFIKIFAAIFEKIDFFKHFFLRELPLILAVSKKRNSDICTRTLDIEFERDWSVGLGGTLGDSHTEKLKNFFFSFRDFFGKSRKCHVIGF